MSRRDRASPANDEPRRQCAEGPDAVPERDHRVRSLVVLNTPVSRTKENAPMPCPICRGPIVTDPENGESFCGLDESHDIDGSELHDDEFPADEPSEWEQDYDPDDPTTWPPEQPWSITSDAAADWALAKVRRARWEIDRINDRADDEKRRVDEWREQTARQFVRDVEFFTHHLTEYRKTVTPAKGKTYRLVNGSLAVAAGSEKAEIEDAVFLDWAEGNDRMDLLRTKVEPNKVAIKEALKAGEVLPGARLVVGEDRYVVDTGKGEPPAVLPMPTDERGHSAQEVDAA